MEVDKVFKYFLSKIRQNALKRGNPDKIYSFLSDGNLALPLKIYRISTLVSKRALDKISESFCTNGTLLLRPHPIICYRFMWPNFEATT